MVDRFGEMAHCVPFSNLSSAKDRAQPDSSLHPAANLGPWSARPLLPTPRLMDQLIQTSAMWEGYGAGGEVLDSGSSHSFTLIVDFKWQNPEQAAENTLLSKCGGISSQSTSAGGDSMGEILDNGGVTSCY